MKARTRTEACSAIESCFVCHSRKAGQTVSGTRMAEIAGQAALTTANCSMRVAELCGSHTTEEHPHLRDEHIRLCTRLRHTRARLRNKRMRAGNINARPAAQRFLRCDHHRLRYGTLRDLHDDIVRILDMKPELPILLRCKAMLL